MSTTSITKITLLDLFACHPLVLTLGILSQPSRIKMPPKGVWLGTVSFLCDSATLTTLCVGWQISGVVLTHNVYLLACAAVATASSMTRLLVGYLEPGVDVPSRRSRHMDLFCSVLEIAALSTLAALLYTTPDNRMCFNGHQEGRLRDCRVVVCH